MADIYSSWQYAQSVNPSPSSPTVPTTQSSSSALEGYRDYGNSDFGDWIGGQYGAKEQASRQSQLDFDEYVRNAASAAAQRQWEEYMSNTQVQRAMNDIKAAGLNPWLAVQSAGFGGSVPSGAAATSSAGQASSGSGGNGLASIGTAAVGIAALVKLVAKFLK